MRSLITVTTGTQSTDVLDCHVNVEIITHAFMSIKYVIKYVTKGADQVMLRAADGEVIDEIAIYQQSRYLSAMEAAWRLMAYPVHDYAPTVEQLPAHLGGEDRPMRFTAGDGWTRWYNMKQKDCMFHTRMAGDLERIQKAPSSGIVGGEKGSGTPAAGEDHPER